MLESLNVLEQEGLDALKDVATAEELPVWYRSYLGRKGRLTDALRGLGAISAEERPAAGRRANEVKTALEEAFGRRQEEVREAALEASLASGALDVTLPGRPIAPGHLHLSTRTLRRIRVIFAEMGFQVYEAPEVDTDEYNFELLNIPPTIPPGTCGTPSGSTIRWCCARIPLQGRFAA